MSQIKAQVSTFAKKSVRIVVIYDSPGGTTKKVAENVALGVSSVDGASVDVLTAQEAIDKKNDIIEYDGFIFGSPTLFGSISWKFKEFLETTSSLYSLRKFQDKVAGGFTNSASIGGDKQGTLLQLFTFASQQGMIWVPLGLPAVNNKTEFNTQAYNRGGFFSGLATQSYIHTEKGTELSESELGTARYYGERFAKVALQYYK